MLAYFTKRPVAANNAQLGLKTMSEVFSALDEESAWKLCREKGIRYLYLTPLANPPFDLKTFEIIKANAANRLTPLDLTEAFAGKVPQYREVLHFWLLNRLGLFPTGRFTGSSGRFRARFMPANSWDLPRPPLMIFEVVPGAEIIGQADPGSTVQARMPLKFDNIRLSYTRETQADASGTFRLRVAYPTSAKSGRIITHPNLEILLNRSRQPASLSIPIPESSVTNGAVITLQQ